MSVDPHVQTGLDGARAATASLLSALDELTDAEVTRPSLLPAWTVGHVLTHLARNADGHVRMLEAAGRGEVGEQYPGGTDARAADIDTGAGRSAAALAADVASTARRLDAAWVALPDAGWDGMGASPNGPMPVVDLPFRRWREVEVHRADLGLAFGAEDWSDAYVEAELARTLPASAGRTPDGRPVTVRAGDDPRRVLAWLLGRATPPDGAPHLTPWQEPPAR